MKHAIIADIHSNLEALTAVLRQLEKDGGFDVIWCLGDIVGYGPDPSDCIQLLRKYDPVCVAGNHDWAATGKVATTDFNRIAAEACAWTSSHLSTEDIDYLNNLPELVSEGDFTLVHGSPRRPLWEYLLDTGLARINMDHFGTPYCLVGHSHVPLIYVLDEKSNLCNQVEIADGKSYQLNGNRVIINPGGLGQPRDGDPRASYMLYDSDDNTVTLFKADYDYSKTQAKMSQRKLPDLLIERLAFGC